MPKTLVFIVLSLLTSTLALAGQEPLRFFDAHYHFPDDATLEFVGRLRKPGEFFLREGALLLSDYNEDNPEALFSLQQMVSQSIARDRTGMKLYGLCGVSLRSPIAAEQVERCLDLPHMVGVKLHLHGSSSRLSNEACQPRHCPPHIAQGYGETFKKVAEVVASKKGLILIHFVHFTEFLPIAQQGYYVNGTGWEEERKETLFLAQVANENPQARFVIAHGGVGSSLNPANIEWLARQIKQRNVYLETSAIGVHGFGFGLCASKERPFFVFADEEWAPLTDSQECLTNLESPLKSPDSLTIVNSWKTLGLDRVLFGTDGPAPAMELESIQYLLHNPHLNDSEKALILRENARSLFPQK